MEKNTMSEYKGLSKEEVRLLSKLEYDKKIILINKNWGKTLVIGAEMNQGNIFIDFYMIQL